nr:MAG TPA: hypothetical protein [Caudoviricetes sp.]
MRQRLYSYFYVTTRRRATSTRTLPNTLEKIESYSSPPLTAELSATGTEMRQVSSCAPWY